MTALVFLYASGLFVGAFLLFVVQPMMGKMILPLLGGSPGVWSTCMLFFQATLLAGYAYAHLTAARLSAPRQAMLHVGLLTAALGFVPLRIDAARLAWTQTPVLQVLLVLVLSVGVPFFVVSASAPMLQHWLAHTGHHAGADPYFLYAASNLGSVLALVSYPTIIEPWLPVRSQGWLSQTQLWTVAYLLLVALTAACALTLRRGADVPIMPASHGGIAVTDVGAGQRLRWIALAFAPSSLLLGVTTYITTDLAGVPLLWVLPLTVYLLTFIITFGRWSARRQRAMVVISTPAVLAVMFLMMLPSLHSRWLLLVHLGLFIVLALTCHGELALRRPPPRHLTEFYLLISVGGALGGVFNALVAPALFRSLLEYPLVIVLAAVLVRQGPGTARTTSRQVLLDLVLASAVGLLSVPLYTQVVSLDVIGSALGRLSSTWSDWFEEHLLSPITYALPFVPIFFLRRRRLALGASLVAVLLVGTISQARSEHYIRQTRNFFGVLRVSRSPDTGTTWLHHGTTLHGRQSGDPERRGEPLSYYHREGPIGRVFEELDGRQGHLDVAVIGLGAGTLAAYARPGDAMTFYEIDPDVRAIAFDPAYFTYISDARARGATVRLEMGDARLRLGTVQRVRPQEHYDLIVVDAFSSDAIPIHLLTREALRLYVQMLEPDGLLALHISNRHLLLEPVLANLAVDAGVGGLVGADEPEGLDADRSTWVVLARTADALGDLVGAEPWQDLAGERRPRVGLWTDDFHNLFSVLKWR